MKTPAFLMIASLLVAFPAFAEEESCPVQEQLDAQVSLLLAADPDVTIDVYRGADAADILAKFDSIQPRPEEAKDADTVVVVSDPKQDDANNKDSVALVKGNCIEIVGHITHDLINKTIGRKS